MLVDEEMEREYLRNRAREMKLEKYKEFGEMVFAAFIGSLVGFIIAGLF